MSEAKPKIHKALAAICQQVKAIGKDSKNQSQGFKFRGVDAVMNAMHPLFAKEGVVILPEVLDERCEERTTKSGSNLIYRILTVKFRFVADDGSEVYSTMLGEGMDSGDKGANKAMAVALKYALSQMFLLPYDEVDPDATTPEPSKPAPKKEKPKGKNFEFLKKMGELKKIVGEERYYQIIGSHGYEKSSEIESREHQIAVWKELDMVAKAVEEME